MESIMNHIERRRFLKVIGAAGITAATLPFARLAMAQSAAPRRVIFFYTPDGCNYEDWHPTATGTNFTLPSMTAPLESVRQHCVFLKGLNMLGEGGSHDGVLKLLTGRGIPGNNTKASGVSLNYYLGQALKSESIQPHLHLNIVPVWGGGEITYDTNGVAVGPESNPLAAFNSLFGGGNTGNTGSSGGNAQNSRALGMVSHARTELEALRKQLGSDEKDKLDAHLQSLSELEHKLSSSAVDSCGSWNFNPTGFKVTRTAFWDNPEYRDARQMGTIADLHTDVAVHALACDLTRVVTIKWNQTVNENTMYEAGTSLTCHGASHAGGAEFVKVKAWYMKYLAKLIEKLNSTPDSNGGTLLDNTLIFHGSCLARGDWHNHDNMPFIIAGGSAGGITGGRCLDFNGVPHNKLLVSIAQFMGQNINTFGDQDPSGGSLPGLAG
jgi:hypothetical protein